MAERTIERDFIGEGRCFSLYYIIQFLQFKSNLEYNMENLFGVVLRDRFENSVDNCRLGKIAPFPEKLGIYYNIICE